MRSEAQAVEKDTREATTPLAHLGAALDVLSVGTGNPKMHIQQARMFLHVAAHREVLQADLEVVLRISQSSVSRNLSLLGKGLRPNEPGYGLLESEEVQHYRRANVVRLTETGKALAWDVQQALVGRGSRSVRPPSPSSPS